MKTSALVVKDNRMIEACYTLDLIEQRIVLMALAWSRSHQIELTHDTWVELWADDYAALYAVDLVTAYRQLRAACVSLQSREIKIRGKDHATGAPATYISKWVNPAIYVDSLGLVRLRFDEMLVPYVSKLETQFTSYQIGSVSALSSTYAIRLYELLSQYKKIGRRTISVGDLKQYLECDSAAYDRMDNFKRRVVDIAVQQINQCTDLQVSYESEKMGRRVVGFCFDFQLKRLPPELQSVSEKIGLQQPAPLALSIAENSMLKELSVLTGRSNVELLLEARAAVGEAELFLWLDTQLKAAKTI